MRLLDEDPDLGKWLTPDEVVVARERAMAPVVLLPPGRWAPPACESRAAHLGLFVLDGLIAREQMLCGVLSTEFFGAGDLVQPWTGEAGEQFVPRRLAWMVLQRVRLAVLGPAFTNSAPWPALHRALVERSMQRCASLSTQHAIAQLPRVDMRVLVLLWHLAERWGRVVPGGVVVPIEMSHTMLGRLVGAKRPTVSLALQRLAADGLVTRQEDARWRLEGSAEEAIRRLERQRLGNGRPPTAATAVAKEPLSLRAG